MTFTRSNILLAALAVLVIGCTGDSEPSESRSTATTASNDAEQVDATAHETREPDAGTATVVVGDERYVATGMSCSTDFGGVDTAGRAEGPRENAQINIRLGTPAPDLVLVRFANREKGEFSAIAENSMLVRGTLENYTYDEESQSGSGEAEFVWMDETGVVHHDQITSGTFEMQC